jgi:hypothetical protein
VFDQLWITRAQNRSGVRLVALNVDSAVYGHIIDPARDRALRAMGYEPYHTTSSWARVDGRRVICALMKRAGIRVLESFELPNPGTRICDYRCAFCRKPMIRSASGYGIVYHRDQSVHEHCFNPAVNEGFFDKAI